MSDAAIKQSTVETSDGRELAATAYRTRGTARGSIVLHSALAMPRQFYADFAEWFARSGYHVLTYDFRGIGDSAPEDLRKSTATIGDWAHLDMPAAMRFARQNFDASPLYVFGHSMGGQIMGLLGGRCEPDLLVTFSAQSGYWRLQHPGHKLRVLIGMSVVFPTITRLVGYLPWSALFGGTDIPEPAALQWANWCLNPDYLLGDTSLEGRSNYHAFSAPVLAYSFEDDVWGYREAVDWMMARYCNAEVERVHLAPSDVGFDRIGHFGYFRSGSERLWERLLERIRSERGRS